jgi:Zn-dependent M28 family amino/carboxypeptidase
LPTINVSRQAAELLLGASPETLAPGATGRVARANILFSNQAAPTRNVAGILRGTDPGLRSEYILVDAHYDHVGIGTPVNGDSIFNGADDDASGTVAVIEIARALVKSPPRRSVIFIATTGEERGLIGTNYFIANPLVPLAQIVANFEIEMIGRPDSLAGGPGKGWLTGYERSTMGESLAKAGIPVVLDPRPEQSFFTRSDNIAFARMGIVAHTYSSFNLHTDYHRPSDDVDKVDFPHMTALINASIRAVDFLANGPKQTWHPGGQPVGRGGGEP